jgi:hypothetical protein
MSHQLSRRACPVLPGAPFCALVVLVALLAAACGEQGPPVGDRSVPPSSPSVPPAPSDVAPVPEPPPRFVEPVAGRRERRVPWRLVGAVPGPAVVVEVQAGGPPCDVVTDLSVSESPEAVELTVWAGRTPGARCVGVPAVLGTFRVRVPLVAPLGSRAVRRG